MDAIYDLVIIGGGPAGLTAGIYAGRSRLNALLLERQALGGQVLTTSWVENYPGFPEGIGGFDLSQRMAEQAERFGLKILSQEARGLERSGHLWRVRSPEGDLLSKAVVLAVGADYARLGVPGEDRLRGRGVSYCATCDGAFFQDQPVAVVGGGDTALEEALFLTRFASEVTLIHRRDRLRAAKILQERAKENEKIRLFWNGQVMEIQGDQEVEAIQVVDRLTQEITRLPVKGVFIGVGSRPNTAFLQGIIPLNEAGFVIAEGEVKTPLPGLFVAGDCRKKSLRQIATAVGEGALAAQAALDYLETLPFTPTGKTP